MNSKQFNEDRLVKYARYLQCNILKCEVLRPTICQLKQSDDNAENNKLRPLLIIPILEIPLVFNGEWYYDRNYLPV